MKSLDPHVGMKNGEPPRGRNRTLDALRVPAAIAVIALHVGPYAELPHGLGMDLRALCRWAVPYFALLSGFYVARDWSELVARSQKQVLGLFKIAVVSALVFAPLTVVKFGWADGASRIFSPKVVLGGAYYHLWFLSALIFSLLSLAMLAGWCKPGRLGWIGVALIVSTVVWVSWGICGSFQPSLEAGDFATCAGFLFLGSALGGGGLRVPSRTVGIWLVAAGVVGSVLEVHAVDGFGPRAGIDVRALLGAGMIALGLFAWGHGKNSDEKWAWLGEIGRKYTLWVYLAHPLFIPPARACIEALPLPKQMNSLILVSSTALLTFCAVAFGLLAYEKIVAWRAGLEGGMGKTRCAGRSEGESGGRGTV